MKQDFPPAAGQIRPIRSTLPNAARQLAVPQGFTFTVRASAAHRSTTAVQSASGYQLFNLSPVVVVPVVGMLAWWIPLVPVA